MPVYRNWPEILKVGEHDEQIMLVLCRVLLDESDDFFIRFSKAFPECFSDHEVCGPFPYSVIRQMAEEDEQAAKQEHLVWLGMDNVLEELGIPYLSFEVVPAGFSRETITEHLFPLPWEEARNLKPTEVFEWRGARFVVLENDCGAEPMCCFLLAIPEELILLDQ